MLQKEVKILEKLKHPNICQLKEVFYEEDYISEWVACCLGVGSDWLCTEDIVLEWVPGGDLLEYILGRNGLSKWFRLRI